MSIINDENNNAVEHLLLGHPREAIAALMRCLQMSKAANGIVSAPTQNDGHEGVREIFLYSVEMSHEIHESAQPAFPFAWYGRPIVISSSDDDDANCTEGVPFSPEVTLAVILYNLGVAFQLECANPQWRRYNAPKRTHRDAVEAYTMALRALMSLPQAVQLDSIGDRLSLGLLHVAIVNNLLFLYAQTIDIQGVRTCFATLCDILAKICNGMPSEHMEDFAFFLKNTILFRCSTPETLICLPLAPAA